MAFDVYGRIRASMLAWEANVRVMLATGTTHVDTRYSRATKIPAVSWRMDDDDLRWQRGRRYPGADYRIFTTAFVDATHARTGKATRFSLLEAVDWVNVIALTPDDRVVLIRQYRAGTDTVHIEIPGGMIDGDEDPQAAAARELVEETGYTAKTWRKLGRVAPNPAFQNNYLHSYLALDAEATHPTRFDGNEVIALETLPLADVHAMIRDGRIDHALVIDAFAHLALLHGELRRP